MKMWNALCVAVTLVATTGWVMAGDQDFELVNKTGVEINALYVSPSASDEWGEDILGADTLADGATVEIKFNTGSKAKLWDLRVEDGEGNPIIWTKLNLLKITKITLFYNAKKKEATATTEEATATNE
jgi:hypothetical protein